jgi:hypothetical protein
MNEPFWLAVAIVAGIAVAAGATRADSPKVWFVIDYSADRCVTAASISAYSSPEAAHAALVGVGHADDVRKVYRSPTDEVWGIAQEIPGVGGILWFTDIPTCDSVRELTNDRLRELLKEPPGNQR